MAAIHYKEQLFSLTILGYLCRGVISIESSFVLFAV